MEKEKEKREEQDNEDYDPGSLEAAFQMIAFYINYSIEYITGVIREYNK